GFCVAESHVREIPQAGFFKTPAGGASSTTGRSSDAHGMLILDALPDGQPVLVAPPVHEPGPAGIECAATRARAVPGRIDVLVETRGVEHFCNAGARRGGQRAANSRRAAARGPIAAVEHGAFRNAPPGRPGPPSVPT